ncbi:Transcriptional regulator, AbiEi antitoxin, Type IV TA system [Raineyella antarctica]|uniref:Transcriptional regulator, AbiEi antitoxin, Type IV TA system n=1 Tax=Raineyella antarctica TaxID=1577474 RepID=A0A1G6GRH2_9ACTN|nr:type IV toxin-antitoxin system AbiEi family antitoxin domain-containing protein [Raineyella antarctica]SDB84548.1 Transcriptional regulator, AbiEi antitoxin, Type IV TA system [Raineyella antarctica]
MSTLQRALPTLVIPARELFTTADLTGPDGDRSTIRRAVAQGEIVKVCHGVYARELPADPVERHLQLVRACLVRTRHPGAVGGLSAALVHGLAVGDWSLPARATLVRPGAGGGGTSDVEVISSRLPAAHVCTVDRMPVTSIARTIVDVARRSSWHEDLTAIVAADAALRRAADPTALREECEQVILDLRGCAGLAMARSVLRSATHQSAGTAETVSRVLLQRMGMPTPLLDLVYPIGADGIDWIDWIEEDGIERLDGTVRVPFSWPALRILGMVLDAPVAEGGVPRGWAGDRLAWEAGARSRLRGEGWYVVEWSLDELRHPWSVSRRLGAVIRESGQGIDLREVRAPSTLVALPRAPFPADCPPWGSEPGGDDPLWGPGPVDGGPLLEEPWGRPLEPLDPWDEPWNDRVPDVGD